MSDIETPPPGPRTPDPVISPIPLAPDNKPYNSAFWVTLALVAAVAIALFVWHPWEVEQSNVTPPLVVGPRVPVVPIPRKRLHHPVLKHAAPAPAHAQPTTKP